MLNANLSQEVHQAIYLKNIVGPVLGIRRAIVFDMHTGVLDEHLAREVTRTNIMIFFKHFTPETLVKALVFDQHNATPEEKIVFTKTTS